MKRHNREASGALLQDGGSTRSRFPETCELPEELIELHPLVRELRQTLESKEAALADKEKEIVRLQVALAFGLRRLPAPRTASPPDAWTRKEGPSALPNA